MLGRTICTAILACVSSAFADSPSETIPLKDIWAYRMPGTRDIRELEPSVYGKARKLTPDKQQQAYESSLIRQIIVSLSADIAASAGIAVPGTDQTALNATYDVLVRHKASSEINSNQEATIVFFSREFNYYVHITSVERQNNVFRIHYEFVGHETKETTVHFALIPVGKLSPGAYSVEIERSHKSGENQNLVEWERRVICKPFSFEVRRGADNPEKGVQP